MRQQAVPGDEQARRHRHSQLFQETESLTCEELDALLACVCGLTWYASAPLQGPVWTTRNRAQARESIRHLLAAVDGLALWLDQARPQEPSHVES